MLALAAVLLLLLLSKAAAAEATTSIMTTTGAPVPLTVACAANASASERHAAAELAHYLEAITAKPVLAINATRSTANTPQLAVGYEAARLLGVSASALTSLGREGYVLHPSGASLALSGGEGAPRGTLYAVNEFLEALGVQFLAIDVTTLPPKLPTQLPVLRPHFVPPLQYRQTYSFQFRGTPLGVRLSADLNLHMRTNKANLNWGGPAASSILDAAHGGTFPTYASPPGYAHTSYALLPGSYVGGEPVQHPPPALFSSRRGWFWPQADNESAIYGQLCWSNQSLQDFLVTRVKGYLRQQPEADFISISQSKAFVGSTTITSIEVPYSHLRTCACKRTAYNVL